MTRITHQTAVLAKEKGYSIRCDQYYSKQPVDYEVIEIVSDDVYLLQRRRHGMYEVYIQDYNNKSGEVILPYRYGEDMLIDDDDCSAPTQSELQKWLRDEHTIDITVITNWKKGGRVYYVGLSYVKDNEVWIWFSSDTDKFKSKIEYITYEEALEEGLLQALNLIP